MAVCPEFSPSAYASWCVCNMHWNHHSVGARTAFWSHAERKKIDAVISACKRDNQNPCPGFVPIHDYERGTAVPDCTCGRPRRAHPPGEVLKGVKKWREAQAAKNNKIVCGQFYGSVDLPGTCSVCKNPWIRHAPQDRGLVIEAFNDVHQSWCKSIIMNGDVQCSCMTEQEIQAALDRLGKKKETTVACKSFKSRSPGNTWCGTCNEPFYSHSVAACNGYRSFIEWRAASMNNHELLAWFMSLPGNNRLERIRSLERLLTDPGFQFHPPPNMINPNPGSMLALLETLDGGAFHRVKSPRDLEKESTVEAQVIHAEDLPLNEEPKKYLCHACGEMDSTIPGNLCSSCNDYMVAHTPQLGPALRSKEDLTGAELDRRGQS